MMSPENHVGIEDGYLSIAHASQDVLALIDIPDIDHCWIEVHADYFPKEVGDQGGLIVWRDAQSNMEFLESADTSPAEYTLWRLRKKKDQWDFFAKKVGWEFFDTGELRANKMGLVLKNGRGANLHVNRFLVTVDNRFYITNLLPGWKIERHEGARVIETKTVQTGAISVFFDDVIWNGTIVIKDENGLTIVERTGEFFGGDIFEYGTYLKIFVEDKLADIELPTDLGEMRGEERDIQMLLYNPSADHTAENVTLKIGAYMDHDGWEWVKIARDQDGKPGTYEEKLMISMIKPQQKIPFWIRISRDSVAMLLDPIYFELFIEHE